MIRITPIRLIGPENEQIGVIETHQAIRMAEEAGLDLVEVVPDGRPPVCKIMDYGKYKYELSKKKQPTKDSPNTLACSKSEWLLGQTPMRRGGCRRIMVIHC